MHGATVDVEVTDAAALIVSPIHFLIRGWLAGWLVWMVPARIGGAPPRTRHRFLTFPHDGCYMYVYRQAAAVGALTSRPGTQPRNTAHASGERARVSIYVYVCARARPRDLPEYTVRATCVRCAWCSRFAIGNRSRDRSCSSSSFFGPPLRDHSTGDDSMPHRLINVF